MKNISAIILAAGESKRMGRNKLSLPYKGMPLIGHTFQLVDKIDFLECIVVISPKNAEDLIGLNFPKKTKIVYNFNPERGQSYSVVLGTKEAKGEGYLFFTGDQPLLTVEIIEGIVGKAAINRIVYPLKEDGKPSNPTFFGKDFREELLSIEGDEGGRQIRKKHPQACYSFTPEKTRVLIDTDALEDIDSLEDIDALKDIDTLEDIGALEGVDALEDIDNLEDIDSFK